MGCRRAEQGVASSSKRRLSAEAMARRLCTAAIGGASTTRRWAHSRRPTPCSEIYAYVRDAPPDKGGNRAMSGLWRPNSDGPSLRRCRVRAVESGTRMGGRGDPRCAMRGRGGPRSMTAKSSAGIPPAQHRRRRSHADAACLKSPWQGETHQSRGVPMARHYILCRPDAGRHDHPLPVGSEQADPRHQAGGLGQQLPQVLLLEGVGYGETAHASIPDEQNVPIQIRYHASDLFFYDDGDERVGMDEAPVVNPLYLPDDWTTIPAPPRCPHLSASGLAREGWQGTRGALRIAGRRQSVRPRRPSGRRRPAYGDA